MSAPAAIPNENESAIGGKKGADKKEGKEAKGADKKEGKDAKGAEGADGKGADGKGADGKGADAAKGAVSGKSVCVDTVEKPCHMKITGQKLMNLEKDISDYFDKKIKDAGHNFTEGIKNSVNGQLKCGKNTLSAIPNMISEIGKSTANAISGISKSVNELGGKDLKGFPNIFVPFQNAYLLLVHKLQSALNQAALGKNAEQILADPNLNSRALLQKIGENSRIYKLITRDPEFQNFLKKWMDDYAAALVSSLDAAQPAIDKMTAKAQNIIDTTSHKLGDTLGDGLTNIIKSTVSAVPVVGAVVSGLGTIGKIGNQILETCEPGISKGAGIVLPIANAVDYQMKLTQCKAKQFVRPITNALARIEKLGNSAAGGGGGVGKHFTRKQLKHKIDKATRRVQHLLTKFTITKKKQKKVRSKTYRQRRH
jgi:hypothetical protein